LLKDFYRSYIIEAGLLWQANCRIGTDIGAY
jgi:hypothetical protein